MTRSRPSRALLPVLPMLCASVVLLAGCSREADDWRAAQATDTVAAYQQFMREHPASSHGIEAGARAAQLVEEEDWRRAQEEDTLQAYQVFLSQHPGSGFAPEARLRVETIRLGSSASAEPVMPGPPAPAATTSGGATEPAAAAAAPARAADASPYGVQLGAFGSEAAARTQWTALLAKHAAPLGGRSPRVVAAKTAGGASLYRLQTPTRDEPEARELCRVLTAAGQACVVVHP